MFNGIMDISHHNDVDLSAAKDAGIVAVIHKATQGTTFQDPMYASRRTEAVKLGLLWGAYHFGTGDDVSQQLQNFLKTAQLGPHDLAALDYETNSGDQMTLAQAEQFVTMFHQQNGFYPLIYGSSLLKSVSATSPLASCKLWIAEYVSASQPALPSCYPSFALWQFTDGNAPTSLSTAGVTVDRDCFDGTEEQLIASWPFR